MSDMRISDQIGAMYGALERARREREATRADNRRTRRWVKAQMVVLGVQIIVAAWMVIHG